MKLNLGRPVTGEHTHHKGHANHVKYSIHPYFKTPIRSNINSSLRCYTEDDGTNSIITQKSLDSLKQIPIPFYVKPSIPYNAFAQRHGHMLEGKGIFDLIDNMEQWENDR